MDRPTDQKERKTDSESGNKPEKRTNKNWIKKPKEAERKELIFRNKPFQEARKRKRNSQQGLT